MTFSSLGYSWETGSLTLDAVGFPVISFIDYAGPHGYLGFIRCTSITCNVQEDLPSFLNVRAPNGGSSTGIIIGNDGVPVISYVSGSGLTVARAGGIEVS